VVEEEKSEIALDDEIEELKKKKLCLQQDVAAMTSSADEYAEKAEETTKLRG